MTRLICFDLDGTLVDSRADIAQAVNESLKHYHIEPVPLDKIAELVGDGLGKTVERAAAGHEIVLKDAIAYTVEYYLRHPVVYTVLYDGVEDTIKSLKTRGYKIALFTNKVQKIAEKILELLQIKDYFDFIIGAESGFPLKPDPQALQFVINHLQADKKESIMVGDGYTDLEAGRRAGIKTCLCCYGYGDRKHFTPDYKIDRFGELLGIVTG